MKVKKRLQQTKLFSFPKEWKMVKLGEVAQYINGYAFKPNQWKNKGLPIIRIQNLTNKNAEVNYFDGDLEPQYKIKDGDLLISWSATLGIFKWSGGNAWLNQHIFKVDKYSSEIFKEYFYYIVSTRIKSMQKKQHGSTMKHIVKKDFVNIPIPLPPLPEQKKIAEILSTVDEVIEKVDKAIEKTERLKKGLMQELLTGRKRVKGFVGLRVNGVNGVGKKEEYKDTEIGRIPKEWEIGFLGFVESVGFIESQLCEIIMGQSPPSTTYNKEQKGLPFLQGKMEFGELYPNPSIYCSQPIKIAEKNDILISVRAPVGEVNISTGKVCIGRGLAAIRCNPYKLYHLFLFYYLKHFGKKLSNISVGSTFKSIRKEELSNFAIPLPPLPEQKKIVEFLSSVDKKLELLHNRKNRYEKVKKGLMNDLLTGKKRVKVNKALNSKSEILNKSK